MMKTVTELQKKLDALPESKRTQRIELLAEIAWETGYDDLEGAQKTTDKVLKLAADLGYEYGTALGQRNLGFLCYASADFKQALVHSKNAVEYFDRIQNRDQCANTVTIMGLIYWSLGNYDFSVEQLGKSTRYFREIKNYERLAWALTILGGVNEDLGEHERALNYHQESMTYFRDAKNSLGEARALTGIGTVYMGMKRYEEALECHQKSLKIYEKIDNKVGLSRAYNDIGLIHQEQGDYKRAMVCHQKSLEIRLELKNKHIIITSRLNIGKLYNQMKSADEALKALQEARDLAEEVEAKPKLYQIHHALSVAFELRGELKYALLHLRLYESVKDQVFSEESSAKVKNMEIQHEVEAAEKEAEIHKLRNIELKAALDDLQQAQVQLVQTERMAVLGQLTAGIAHEINNPIGAAKSSADISLRGIRQIKSELEGISNGSFKTLDKTLKIMEKNGHTTMAAVERISKIVGSLKNFSRLDEAEYKLVNLHEGIESTLTLLQYSFPDSVTVEKKFGDIPEILVYPNRINQVFMTLLTNAVQAVDENGRITIETKLEKMKVVIEISDNGKGIPDEIKEKIFDLSFTTKGKRVGFGMGLYNVYNIIQNHSGEISVESEIDTGTRFMISLPLK